MVKWIYTLKLEPFILLLWVDSAADVDANDGVDRTFLKRLKVSKKTIFKKNLMFKEKLQKELINNNKTKLVINNSNFKVLTGCKSKSKKKKS